TMASCTSSIPAFPMRSAGAASPAGWWRRRSTTPARRAGRSGRYAPTPRPGSGAIRNIATWWPPRRADPGGRRARGRSGRLAPLFLWAAAMRLNKHISETGACSRREADRLIGEGRVTVNGVRARIGAEVGEGDEVRLDGQPLRPRAAAPGKRRHVYIALYKPVGITCTTESSVAGNIVDFVGHEQRIFPIGR